MSSAPHRDSLCHNRGKYRRYTLDTVVPAGTIAGLDMVTQFIARVYGPEWMRPFVICEYSTGKIEVVGGPPDREAARQMLESAYDQLLRALQIGTLVAQVE